MNASSTPPTIILIAGHWLGAWAWDDIRAYLDTDRAEVVAITMPGLDRDDPRRLTRTLDDQAAAIRGVIAQHGDQPVVLVAHSGANAPVSLVLDRYSDLIARVVWVDSGPVASGTVFAPDLPDALDELPLPPFEALGQQASLEGLSVANLERFRDRAVTEPASILRQPVTLVNEARHRVPTTLVCCSMSSEQVMELARAGHPMFAEVAHLEHLDVIDLSTGHWPMWSRPRDLAQIIESVATQAIENGPEL